MTPARPHGWDLSLFAREARCPIAIRSDPGGAFHLVTAGQRTAIGAPPPQGSPGARVRVATHRHGQRPPGARRPPACAPRPARAPRWCGCGRDARQAARTVALTATLASVTPCTRTWPIRRRRTQPRRGRSSSSYASAWREAGLRAEVLQCEQSASGARSVKRSSLIVHWSMARPVGEPSRRRRSSFPTTRTFGSLSRRGEGARRGARCPPCREVERKRRRRARIAERRGGRRGDGRGALRLGTLRP